MTRTPRVAAFAAVTYTDGPDAAALAALTRFERASLGHADAPQRAAAILAAKRAVQRLHPGLDLRDIEVLRRQHCAPVLRLRGRETPLPLSLSLSHGDGLAVAALLADPEGTPCAR
ncbi:hypothetical protein [Streptomyces sp. NPDC037389]|uniref:hypothetical protein n=1 Tax=Streptomyces sp. NPDC037389 TaxID=3155369 RepID=UPI0033CEC57F